MDEYQVLLRRSWWDLPVPDELPTGQFGMIRPHEVSLLYHLARDYYRGLGEIIDGGAFLGKSTRSLALGLQSNPHVGRKSERIHSFDKFVADEDYIIRAIQRAYDPGLHLGDSFRHRYENAIRDVRPLVRVYQGDFSQIPWSGEPVEILFVDIAKTPALHRHILLEFFPCLIPGRSIVIYQDYHHPHLPFIHLSMEFLHDAFVIVDHKVDDSIVFLATDRPDPRDLQRAAEGEFARDEQLALFHSAIGRIPMGMRQHVELAKAVLVRRLYGEDEFLRELHALDLKYGMMSEDPHWALYRSKFPGFITPQNRQAAGEPAPKAGEPGQRAAESLPTGSRYIFEARLEQLQLAEIDLTLLLRKLASPPLGWLLRTRKNFRKLLDRYVHDA